MLWYQGLKFRVCLPGPSATHAGGQGAPIRRHLLLGKHVPKILRSILVPKYHTSNFLGSHSLAVV